MPAADNICSKPVGLAILLPFLAGSSLDDNHKFLSEQYASNEHTSGLLSAEIAPL